MARARKLHLRWEPLPWLFVPLLRPMSTILAAWEGTKYGSGQSCRGALADCIGFVFGAIDDLDGRPRARSATMPPDTALHDPETSSEALRALRALYEPIEVISSAYVQPFDIVVVGPSLGGPSHAMLVGPQKNTLWHATPASGVHRAGWALGDGYEAFHGAFRISDRTRWLK